MNNNIIILKELIILLEHCIEDLMEDMKILNMRITKQLL